MRGGGLGKKGEGRGEGEKGTVPRMPYASALGATERPSVLRIPTRRETAGKNVKDNGMCRVAHAWLRGMRPRNGTSVSHGVCHETRRGLIARNRLASLADRRAKRGRRVFRTKQPSPPPPVATACRCSDPFVCLFPDDRRRTHSQELNLTRALAGADPIPARERNQPPMCRLVLGA